jgi:predicted NAD/FAD-binding protein
MRIAVIGAGISGLVAAYVLSRRHDITVFESASYIGGHTHTVDVDDEDGRHAVDTGFIVFNDRTYPTFVRLLDRLGVASQPSTMSFSVRCAASGFEYNGTSLNGLFAERGNLLNPAFYGLLRDILRFNREAPGEAARMNGATVAAFLAAHPYGSAFRDRYLVPMGASIWSCPPGRFLEFPVGFVMEFFANHGILQVSGRPTWRVVRGGSARYVEALTRTFAHRVRLNAAVRGVRRTPDGIAVRTGDGVEAFDEVVFGCHADQALGLLEDPTVAERDLLSAFPYQPNDTLLHTDTTMLPRRRRAWAAWNYLVPRGASSGVTVTYNMNLLQRLPARQVYCVSLNATAGVAAPSVLGRYTYHHPLYTTRRDGAQRRHADVIRVNRTSFCGAYWGYGFHEDGVASALRVCLAFGEEL